MAFKPREYQLDIANKIATSSEKRILVQLLTGMGKTKLSFYLMDELLRNKTFLFLTPRINLALQTFQERGGLGLIQGATKRNLSSRIVVGTAQTVARRAEKKQFSLNRFDYIVIDEVHAIKYRDTTIFSKMSDPQKIEALASHAKIIALTATPFNGDATPLIGWGKSECVTFGEEYDFDYAVGKGYLSDVLIREVAEIDDTKLKISKSTKDFTEKSVNEMIDDNPTLDIVGSCSPYIVGKTAVFASSIKHCDDLNKEFLSHGYKSEVMHSKMVGKPHSALERFNLGKIDVLITKDMLSFGQDVKNLETLIFATAVASISRFLQMIGRGLRPSQNKTYCHILDCMGNVNRLGHPFDKVTISGKAENRKEPVFCKECGSKKPLLLIEKKELPKFEMMKITKQCKECFEKVETLLPMPMIKCEKCMRMYKLTDTIAVKTNIFSRCECGYLTLIDTLTPKDMMISFRNRDDAKRKIVEASKQRMMGEELDSFLTQFAIFSVYCKEEDLGSIMNFMLNLKDNYSDNSLSKITERMKQSNKKNSKSVKSRFISSLNTLQGKIDYEFVDFLFKNLKNDEQNKVFLLLDKIRKQIKRDKAKKQNGIISTKRLISLAKRNIEELKDKK